jgi:hypothetical protein
VILPAVVGEESGSANYSVKGKNGEISVSYQWGKEAIQAVSETPTTTTTNAVTLPPVDAFMKGITYADWAPPEPPLRWPGLYFPPQADPSLRELALTGANWIGLIVVARQETIDSTTIEYKEHWTATDPELRHVVDLAHSLGIRVMLRTGVGLYNDPKHWSGDIGSAFTTETQWQEWFASYRDYINHFATFSQEAGVDMLCIGIEMGGVTDREQDWRRIIAEVRERLLPEENTLFFSNSKLNMVENGPLSVEQDKPTINISSMKNMAGVMN